MRLKIKKPIVFRQNFLPAKGFKAMNLFGIIFAKKNARLDDRTLNHETIHTNQIFELALLFLPVTLFISFKVSLWLLLTVLLPFYVLYGLEWLIKFIYYNFKRKTKEEYDLYWAYKNLSFEREAYVNDTNQEYLNERKFFAWFKYITKKH